MIVKQFFSKLSDVEESKFVYDRHEKCGKQGKGSVNQKLGHHGAGIKEQSYTPEFHQKYIYDEIILAQISLVFRSAPSIVLILISQYIVTPCRSCSIKS